MLLRKDPFAKLSWLRVASIRLLMIGFIAFGLSAPVLIPFVEYLTNCESYKMHVVTAGLPWQAILANYLFPFQSKASTFLGPLSLWGLIAAFVYLDKFNRFVKPLIFCFLISLIGIIRPFPLDALFHVAPLSMTFC